MSRFLCDIGVNLLDSQFRGKYHGKRAHAADFEAMLRRASAAGVTHAIVTATDLWDARRAVAMVRAHRAAAALAATEVVQLRTTVGVHPTHTRQLVEDAEAAARATEDAHEDAATYADTPTDVAGIGEAVLQAGLGRTRRGMTRAEYIAALDAAVADGVADGSVVAIGECGLDYDRLFFSPKEVQLANFELHFDLAEKYRLPLFLHDRNTGGDFLEIIRRHAHRLHGGVVHSFTGTAEEAAAYLELGLFIGINGCSLKTEDNLAVLRDAVPLDRLMLETDAPWCDIRKTHASYKHVKTQFKAVKKEKYGAVMAASAAGDADAAATLVQGRNELCTMMQVAEVVAGVKGVPVEAVLDAAEANTKRLFFPGGEV